MKYEKYGILSKYFYKLDLLNRGQQCSLAFSHAPNFGRKPKKGKINKTKKNAKMVSSLVALLSLHNVFSDKHGGTRTNFYLHEGGEDNRSNLFLTIFRA